MTCFRQAATNISADELVGGFLVESYDWAGHGLSPGMIKLDTQATPTARAMPFFASEHVQLSKCAKNTKIFTLPRIRQKRLVYCAFQRTFERNDRRASAVLVNAFTLWGYAAHRNGRSKWNQSENG